MQQIIGKHLILDESLKEDNGLQENYHEQVNTFGGSDVLKAFSLRFSFAFVFMLHTANIFVCREKKDFFMGNFSGRLLRIVDRV